MTMTTTSDIENKNVRDPFASYASFLTDTKSQCEPNSEFTNDGSTIFANDMPALEPYFDIIVYTDGSTLKNGSAHARSGVGLYYGANDPRNLSLSTEPLKTNNRAELFAIWTALKENPPDKSLLIYTDSEYSINALTKKNRWLTNVDLIEPIWQSMQNRTVALRWVKGHESPGNIEADKLAKQASGSLLPSSSHTNNASTKPKPKKPKTNT